MTGFRMAMMAGAACALLGGCMAPYPTEPLPGPGPAPAPMPAFQRVTGTISYRERIALQPDAVIRVRVEEVGRADAPSVVLAEDVIRAGGRQPPFPFDLSFNAARVDRYSVLAARAEVRDGRGRLLWTTDRQYRVTPGASQRLDLMLVRVSGPAPSPAPAPVPPSGGNGRTVTYRCDTGGYLTATFDRNAARFRWAGRDYRLPQVPSGSGARYSDGRTTIWNKGGEVTLALPGGEIRNCVEAGINPGGSVTIKGREWVLEDVGGRGVPDNARATFRLAADGQISGSSGCNRYSGRATATNGRFRLQGPVASTRMACAAPSLNDLERRFLSTLEEAVSWRIENGLLYLLDGRGRTLMRFSA